MPNRRTSTAREPAKSWTRGATDTGYRRQMGNEKINPAGLVEPPGYSHVVVATSTRRVYIAGQTGVGADGAVVGTDLASQTAQAFRNVAIALAAGGVTWDDVVKMNILVVGYEPSMAEAIFAGVGEVFGENMPAPAATLVRGELTRRARSPDRDRRHRRGVRSINAAGDEFGSAPAARAMGRGRLTGDGQEASAGGDGRYSRSVHRLRARHALRRAGTRALAED